MVLKPQKNPKVLDYAKYAPYFLATSFLLFAPHRAQADVLLPGTINQCGELAAAGTYTLDDSLGAFDNQGPCFTITADGVIIDVSQSNSLQGDISADGTTTPVNHPNGFSFTVLSGSNNFWIGDNISSQGINGGLNGTTTFDGSYNNAIVTGNAMFVDGGINGGGSVSGDALFDGSNVGGSNNGPSYNNNIVGGNATFTYYSCNDGYGVVQGNATFLNDSGNTAINYSNNTPTILGTATFFGGSYNQGTVTGTSTFDSSTNFSNGILQGNAIFDDGAANNGLVQGNATFSNDSGNYGGTADVVGNATFYNGSYNQDTINGNVTFFGQGNGNSQNNGNIGGNATFYFDSTNNGNISGNAYFYNGSYSGDISNTNDGNSNNYGIVGLNAFFYDGAGQNGTVSGNATFYNGSYNTGPVTGNGYFYSGVYGGGPNTYLGINNIDTSNEGPVSSDAFFYDGATNQNGHVLGNATFTGTSSSNYNGYVAGNADVYFPAERPLQGSVGGVITYHGFGGFYFNDTAAGHGITGNWADPLNWWTTASSTVHTTGVPLLGDDTYIISNLTTASGTSPTAGVVTFENGANNNINLTSSGGVTFNDTSVQASGTITGSAVFSGDASNFSGGTVTGSVTRQYTSNATTSRNFTTEGSRNNWIVTAYNATVNLTSAVYSVVTNVFKAFGNAVFIWNPSINGGASVVPVISFNTPVAGTSTIKWVGYDVNWGNSATCEYKLDGADYATTTCADPSLPLPRPSAGTHTITVEGINAGGSLSEKSIIFTYDNTKPYPIGSDCSIETLDESSRPYYYLTGNTTGTCTFETSATLIGMPTTDATSTGFTLNGNVVADGVGSLTLENINVTGTVSANATSSGASAGNITIATSTTGAITANGADGSGDGGNGGTISIWNSDGVSSNTIVSANGGSSNSCGNGGNAGTITLNDYTNYSATSSGGNWSNLGCPGSSSYSDGQYTTPVTTPRPTPPPSTPSNPSPTPSYSGGSSYATPVSVSGNGVTPSFTLPLNPSVFTPVHLTPLPSFGGTSTKNSFNLLNPLSDFVFQSLPSSITDFFKISPTFQTFLTSIGITSGNDLANLVGTPLKLSKATLEKLPAGFFTIDSNNKPLSYTLTSAPKYPLTQLVHVSTGSSLNITLSPITKDTTIIWNGKTYFPNASNSLTIIAPKKMGRYFLTSPSTPLSLEIDVVSVTSTANQTPSVITTISSNPVISAVQSVINWIGGWWQ